MASAKGDPLTIQAAPDPTHALGWEKETGVSNDEASTSERAPSREGQQGQGALEQPL